MRIMGTGPREDVHWGQCFEEFYGPEYCKNLKKDLEKLKDEFYDGNAQCFQREWVVPTANLLRRMRHMGFPVRTRDFIIIHLYNPVDSMFAGEMHFQVGRKAPGTLTLKFTKQNSNGTFVIQPKTLSNADEMRLQEDPLDFLDGVRMEMRGTAVDAPSLLRTLVLMTETCKLQRQCAKAFFSTAKENFPTNTTPSTNHFHDIPAAVPPPFNAASIPFTSNQWPTALVNPDVNSVRPDGNFPFPLSFCVKNYVNCNTKPELNPQNVIRSSHHRMPSNPQTAGTAYRQARSSTFHSEPEENDETMNPQSFTENNWPRHPPDSLEEIQRRMSDTRLWEASKGAPSADQKPPSGNAPMYGQPFKQYGPNVAEAKVWNYESRTSLTDEYTGDSGARLASGEGPGAAEPARRLSEPRTAATEQYFQSASHLAPAVLPNPDRRDSNAERTSLTEEYAGESSSNVASHGSKEAAFKGTFANAIASSHRLDTKVNPSGSVSPRTAVVNDYAGSSNNNQNAPGGASYVFMQRQAAAPLPQSAIKHSSPGMCTNPETGDGRRTSSLDAYVGSVTAGLTANPQDPKARSEGNLTTASRTNVVDQYFQNQQQPNMLPPLGYYWQDQFLGRDPNNGQAPANGNIQYLPYVQDFSRQQMLPTGVPENNPSRAPCGPEETANSLDSWMSHVGTHSLAAPNDRLRANSIGSGFLRSRMADEGDMSLLSHTSYPSWGSHPAIHANHPNGGMLPLAIEQINKDSQNWQKWAPQNSLN